MLRLSVVLTSDDLADFHLCGTNPQRFLLPYFHRVPCRQKTCDKNVVTWLVYRVHALRTLASFDRQNGCINKSAFVSLTSTQ